MAGTYKKYMKKSAKKRDYSLIHLFIISFFGMLLVFTVLIKSFSPSVDVSIGDYKQESEPEMAINVDDRLSAIQDEDRVRDFADLMKRADDIQIDSSESGHSEKSSVLSKAESAPQMPAVSADSVFKVYIGTYTSAEQAKVAKDIIQETGLGLNPIVKCIGSNDYTLQVGIFKNKTGAETLLSTIQQNHLPGRIVEEN